MTQQFQALLLQHMPRLRAYAQTLTRNAPDADDLMQSAALKALRNESTFQMGTNFLAWAHRIVRNNHISNCRLAYLRLSTPLDDVAEDEALDLALVTPASQDDHVLNKEIARAVSTLTAQGRQVLSLVCDAQLSYEDAATAMGCTVGTVKSRMWRARKQLKALLFAAQQAAPARPLSTWSKSGFATAQVH